VGPAPFKRAEDEDLLAKNAKSAKEEKKTRIVWIIQSDLPIFLGALGVLRERSSLAFLSEGRRRSDREAVVGRHDRERSIVRRVVALHQEARRGDADARAGNGIRQPVVVVIHALIRRDCADTITEHASQPALPIVAGFREHRADRNAPVTCPDGNELPPSPKPLWSPAT